MTSVHRLSSIGVLAFALGCTRAASSVHDPSETEAPTVMPIERETAGPVVESARASPEQLLGLPPEHPVVREFLGSSKIEEQKFGDSLYAVVHERGFDLLFEAGVITTVFLFSVGKEDHREYTDPMPGGIRFGEHREQVHSKLGLPNISGSGIAWDKWYRETWSLHVQYGADGGIDLVTLMTASSDPNRR